MLVAALFVAVGGVQWWTMNAATGGEPVRAAAAVEALDASSLPAEDGDWKQIKFDTLQREASSAWGEFSKTWTYASPQGAALVSCDYPFSGWHSLVNCYESQGWRIESRKLLPYPDTPDDSQAHYVEIEMQNPDGHYGYLLYGLFDDAGNDMKPIGHEAPLLSRVLFMFRDGWDRGPLGALSGTRVSRTASGSYQFQLLSSSIERKTDEQKQELREQFVELRREVQERLKVEG